MKSIIFFGIFNIVLIIAYILFTNDIYTESKHQNMDTINKHDLYETDDNFTVLEYNRLKSLLSTFPENKPKALIYFLIKHDRIQSLTEALKTVDRYFNNKYQYPIVLFHESNARKHLHRIKNETASSLFFQEVKFKKPNDYKPDKDKCPGFSIGYRHMCNFHSNLVYKEKVLKLVEYAWRLDVDSRILAPYSYRSISLHEEKPT